MFTVRRSIISESARLSQSAIVNSDGFTSLNETIMTGFRSSPEMKMCEIRVEQKKAAALEVMEQSKPTTKLAKPICWIPEWSR